MFFDIPACKFVQSIYQFSTLVVVWQSLCSEMSTQTGTLALKMGSNLAGFIMLTDLQLS